MIFTNLIEANLKTNTIGKYIEYYTQLVSTNKEAWEIINEGTESGTLIITDNQISGKGRNSNEWKSKSGKSLTFSLIYKPETIPIEKIGIFSILTGISVLDGLKELNINGSLKWPNDIILNNKKVGGILCEAKIQKTNIEWVVIGIGINVNESKDDFDSGLVKKATSLFMELGQNIQRERVIASVLNNMELLLKRFENDPINFDISNDWNKYCAHNNKKVSFQKNNVTHSGIFKNITNDGSCIIEVNGKNMHYSGDSINDLQILI